MSLTTCPLCESHNFKAQKALTEFDKGRSHLQYQRVFSRCEDCEFEGTTAVQLAANRRAIVLAERSVADPAIPTPEKILAWRSKWGLTQVDAGKMCKSGSQSFSKYENGALLPSGPTSQLINTLILSDDATRRLAAAVNVPIELQEQLTVLFNAEHVSNFTIGNIPCVAVKNNAIDLSTVKNSVATVSADNVT